MAFADPQSVTINAVAISLPRVGQGVSSGIFQSNDAAVRLTISHQSGKRNRHTIRIDHQKVAADPFVGSTNARYSMSAYVVMDVPPVGYTVAEAKQIGDALAAYLTASTGANITKLLGNES